MYHRQMGPPDRFERGMAAVAEGAAAHVSVTTRADAVLEALHLVVPFDCAALSIWRPEASQYQPLANAGYPDYLYAKLHEPQYRQEHLDLGMLRHRRPLRFRDLPDRGASVPTIAEYALPLGFREGLGMALFSPENRHVGYLSLNTQSRKYPTDRQARAVGLLAGTLGLVVDAAGQVASRLRSQSAIALACDGRAFPLPGGRPLLLDPLNGEALERVRFVVAERLFPTTFLWRRARVGEWQRIQVQSCTDDELPGCVAVAATLAAPVTYGLTARELEILTLMTRGMTNATIAERLVISLRTVTTHVERVLEKLAVATRTEAAVRASSEGLLVWVGEEPPLGTGPAPV